MKRQQCFHKMDKEKNNYRDFTLLNKTIGISVVELNTSKNFFW